MNAARQIIADAARQGATFRLADGKLRLVPPPGKQPRADLVARAKAHREEIVAAIMKSGETNFRTDTRVRGDFATSTRARAREAPAFVVNISDHLARARAAADRRNRECERARLTDRFCAYGRLATLAYPDSAGRERWFCLECPGADGSA